VVEPKLTRLKFKGNALQKSMSATVHDTSASLYFTFLVQTLRHFSPFQVLTITVAVFMPPIKTINVGLSSF
jgi:hypothetical protein